MSICDNQGNLQEDFISRLDTLRAQQDENIRKLESLRIDAAIQKRKSEQTRVEVQNLTPPDTQINEVNRLRTDLCCYTSYFFLFQALQMRILANI